MHGLVCAEVPRGRATLHADVLLKCNEKVDTQKGGPDCNTSNFVSFSLNNGVFGLACERSSL